MTPEDANKSHEFHQTVRELETQADKLLRELADRGFSSRAKVLVGKVYSLAISAKSQADSMTPK
jgi:hypothetical protein